MPRSAAMLTLARGAGEAGIAAIELQPAGAAQVALGVRFRHQRGMLADRTGEQRPHRLHGLDQALRRRVAAERQQPGRDLGEERDMVIGLRRPLEGDAEDGAEAGGKTRRKQRVAFDDAGIAVGGSLAGIAAVDQGDGKAALGEMQRHADADDTGAEHDRIGASHENSCEKAWMADQAKDAAPTTYKGKGRQRHAPRKRGIQVEPGDDSNGIRVRRRDLVSEFARRFAPLRDPC